METIESYLSNTESATLKIFEGIDSYLSILNDGHTPIFTSSTDDEEQFKKELDKWEEEYKEEIQKALDAQNRFVDESFAMSMLCGNLLQLAAMGIQTYSSNTVVTSGFEKVIKPNSKPAKFCIGRLERGIPIGLLIYAGRNQYNHLDEQSLREPNVTIFDKLAQIESFSNKGAYYKDPAFDLSNGRVINYATNITALMGWRNYNNFYSDMVSMINNK